MKLGFRFCAAANPPLHLPFLFLAQSPRSKKNTRSKRKRKRFEAARAEIKQAKKRAKITAKTWDEALPGDGKKLSDAVLKKKKKLNKKKAPAKAKKLTSSSKK